MSTGGKSTAWGPYLLVLAGVVAGLCAVAFGLPSPIGGTTMGCALVAGAVIRLKASDKRAGALVVRNRGLDTVVLGGLGGALVIGSLLLLLHSS